MLISIKTLLSGITQEIHIRVQDVSIDIYISNEKSQALSFSNKNIGSTYNLTVVMPPVFEVSTFKLILKCIFANNFL